MEQKNDNQRNAEGVWNMYGQPNPNQSTSPYSDPQNLPKIKQKWYLRTWFIALLFLLWPLVVPLILGIVLTAKQGKAFKEFPLQCLSSFHQQIENRRIEAEKSVENKRNLFLQEKASLEGEIESLKNNRDIERKKLIQEVQNDIDAMKLKREELMGRVKKLEQESYSLNSDITEKKKIVSALEDEILYQDFGIYTPKYNCMNSEDYRDKIKEIKDKQRQHISNKTALNFSTEWALDGSKSKGTAMNNDNMKMALLAFNNECDVLINKVKFNNVDKIEERIKKSADRINRLNKRNQISITPHYLGLKIEELYLSYEYEQKKQEEKEEIRRIREEEREAQKLQKELEEARHKVEKEKAHYQNALQDLISQITTAATEDIPSLEDKKRDLEETLGEIQKQQEDLDYREANIRAGYVYVISNIGSFGEGILKIGMTRRLNPLDRVNELGDASVPFKFDIHAMIFSDDAPGLENALHQAFTNQRVNLVNNRKEFFKVSLDDVKRVIKANHDKSVDFTMLPEAEQFRESQMMLRHGA